MVRGMEMMEKNNIVIVMTEICRIKLIAGCILFSFYCIMSESVGDYLILILVFIFS